MAPTLAMLMLAGLLQEAPAGSQARVRLLQSAAKDLSVTLTFAADLPQGTHLSVEAVGEAEFIAHAREVRLYTSPESDTSGGTKAVVNGGRISVPLQLPRAGYYRVTVVYVRMAQRDPMVLKTLGSMGDSMWHDAIAVIDAPALPAQLAQDEPAVETHIDRAWAQLDKIAKEIVDAKAWAKRSGPVMEEVARLLNEAKKHQKKTLYNASMETVVQTLSKMTGFDPGVPRKKVPPGSAEEAMIVSMSEDIPGDLNDELLMKQCRAYLVRARLAVMRERLLYPLRVARDEWNRLVTILKDPASGPEALAAADRKFLEASGAARQVVATIRKDKELAARVSEEMLAQIEATVSAFASLAEDLRKERDKGGDFAAHKEHENKVRQDFVTLDKSLRMIPKE